jgi:signal transduction histidine kinase
MEAPTSVEPVNILLVDDQPAKLLTYEAILGGLGEHLITVTSASNALACLLHHDIAVMLVDVCMPDFDGYELATLIRQHPRCQNTSIIFVSATLMTDLDRLRGYECGAVDYLPVPLVPDILRAKVSVFVELYRKTRALDRLNRDLEQRVAERTSQLEATMASLHEAAQRKDEFLAMLAHELRNPLAPIRTAVEFLRRDDLQDTHRAKARDVIERQVGHLVCLVDELLDVSRITRGLITLRCEPVLIESIVTQAVETARPVIDARRHEVRIEMSPAPLAVDGDKTRLVQVFANVLQNAAKFMDADGQITVMVAGEGPDAVVRVRDAGIGIHPEWLPRVFELFTQVPGATNVPPDGLGIGLALVKRLVEMHGGTATAHSEGPGRGTEITIRLPAIIAGVLPEPPSAAAGQPPPPADVADETHRVLVVDDNRDAAESMALHLRHAGHDVRTAHDGPAALAIAEAFRPAIVLLDLGMPGMSGFDIARHLRQQPWGDEVTIAALTGWGQKEDRQRTARAGFDAHLVKPVSEKELGRVLTHRSRLGVQPDI